MSERTVVSAGEWRRVSGFAAVIMLLTTVPYLVGVMTAGDGWTFGGFVFGAEDGYSYLAKMRLGARGDWLFTLRYTHEPHDGAPLFLPYLLLGKLTALVVDPRSPQLPAALALTFHIARLVCGLGLILVTYRFVAAFVRRPLTRFWALLAITLGGGLGWLATLSGITDALPVDFYVPEGFSFLILLGLPHLALARTALLGGLLLLFRALEQPRRLRYALAAGLCWAVMGLCVPFYLAVIYVVLGAWGLAAWARTRRFPWALFWPAAVAALVTLPLLLVTAFVFLSNDVLGTWSAQNQLPSPAPGHYALAYGALAIPAVMGARWAWRRGSLPHLLLVGWVIAAPVLVYLPVNVQRRLLEGVIVPLGVLAIAGLRLSLPRGRGGRRALTGWLTGLLSGAVLFWLGALLAVLKPGRPLFQQSVELRAMTALNRIAPRDAVVLSLKETGNVLPAWTDLKAYVGHGPETVDADEKEMLAEQFFAGTLDLATQRDLLAVVDYVFWGLQEQALAGAGRTPDLPLALSPEQTAPVLIYEVPHE
ncbi:MAG: hypothetical protein ACUVSU_10855 [Aggregatilineaceae bacterium]